MMQYMLTVVWQHTVYSRTPYTLDDLLAWYGVFYSGRYTPLDNATNLDSCPQVILLKIDRIPLADETQCFPLQIPHTIKVKLIRGLLLSHVLGALRLIISDAPLQSHLRRRLTNTEAGDR